MYLNIYIYVCIYIYVYMCVCVCVCGHSIIEFLVLLLVLTISNTCILNSAAHD